MDNLISFDSITCVLPLYLSYLVSKYLVLNTTLIYVFLQSLSLIFKWIAMCSIVLTDMLRPGLWFHRWPLLMCNCHYPILNVLVWSDDGIRARQRHARCLTCYEILPHILSVLLSQVNKVRLRRESEIKRECSIAIHHLHKKKRKKLVKRNASWPQPPTYCLTFSVKPCLYLSLICFDVSISTSTCISLCV